MSGSSRALVKALNNVFEDPSSLPEVNGIIDQYLNKHNTLKSIHQSTFILHHEFQRIYNHYVDPKKNDSATECMFLTLLTPCIGVFDLPQVDFWLQCYLRPAIDSAGYDNRLVEGCRELIKALIKSDDGTSQNDTSQNDESELLAQRAQIALFVVSKIIDVYLGDYTFMSLEFSDLELNTQPHFERIRFMRKNCCMLINDYAVSLPQTYYEVINTYFLKPVHRLPILTLLAGFVSSSSSSSVSAPTPASASASCITSTPLFKSLLVSLAMDESEHIIVCALSVLCMVVPQIATALGDYLIDMLYIYIRMVLWIQLKGLGDSCDYWEIAAAATSEQGTTALNIDPLNLATLLYGLFPYNFCSFAVNPKSYLKGKKPALLTLADLPFMTTFFDESSDPHETPWDDTLSQETKVLLKSFYFHPKFFQLSFFGNDNKLTLTNELSEPTAWIDHHQHDVHDEVSLKTLGLNPNYFLCIPNYISEQSYDTRSYHSRQSSLVTGTAGNNSSINMKHHWGGLGGFKTNNNSIRNRSSQASFTLSNDRANSGAGLEIRFKDVTFDTPRSNHLDVDDHFDAEPIDELLASHEKLYSTNRSPPPEENSYYNSPPSGKRASSSLLLHEGRSVSIPTTSLETTMVHKRSIGNMNILAVSDGISTGAVSTLSNALTAASLGSPNTNISGVVDFYQRELLLLKNELEFANYMTLLNKYNNVKLTLQNNKALRDLLRLNNGGSSYNESESYQKLSLEIEKIQSANEIQLRKITDRLVELQNENDTLRVTNEKLSQENGYLLKDLDYFTNQVIPNKDTQLTQYKLYIEKLKQKVEDLQLQQKKKEQVESEKQAPSIPSQDTLTMFVFDIKSKVIRLEEKNIALVKELGKLQNAHENTIKKYESKLQHDKVDLGKNINGYVNHYEKRIKELNSIIMKYESVIEEKNARILHLSTSKPISIPEAGNQYQLHSKHIEPCFNPDYTLESQTPDTRDSQSSSTDSIHSPTRGYPKSPPLQPHMHHSSSTIPVLKQFSGSYTIQPTVRGRGGYQKRSKNKLM